MYQILSPAGRQHKIQTVLMTSKRSQDYIGGKERDATDPHSACRKINGVECGRCRTEGAKISDAAPLSLL